jgi:hypothetical protein
MRLAGSIVLALFLTGSVVAAQQSDDKKPLPEQPISKPQSIVIKPRKKKHSIPATPRIVIPPATVLHNPEYLSGEASVTVAANSNPLIRIGMAQNGVTLIEFPSADKFFAVHAGNSDLVTVEKSPSLRRDHHLVLRAGSGFLVPPRSAKANPNLPATSIIAQMDSGMAITLMIYPVPLLKQQAHRLVINYKRDDVISARKEAGLATNLTELDSDFQPKVMTTSLPEVSGDENAVADKQSANSPPQEPPSDFEEPTKSALKDALANPNLFKSWTEARHGLRISVTPPRELNDNARVVAFAVRNVSTERLRLISGYPDLYVETLNTNRNPVEAGMRIQKIYLAANVTGNLIPPGETRVFALAYEAPILGAQQHLKLVVAHMTAADEPAMADITAIAR